MKNTLAFLLYFIFTVFANAQIKGVVFNSKSNNISIKKGTQKKLIVNIPVKKTKQFQQKGSVSYSDFGVIGDGKTDAIFAITAAHVFANKYNLVVKIKDSASYYIGGKESKVNIQTNTDFGNASFIIDDKNVENRKEPVFNITSKLKPLVIKNKIKNLKKNQQKIKLLLAKSALIKVTDTTKRHYIRLGANQNNGSHKTDIFLIDKNGEIDSKSPIAWNFDKITSIKATPIDTQELIIKGGKFITIANQQPSKYNYYKRNFLINRSNVIVENLKHFIQEEGEYGAPYSGFISIDNSCNVTIKNTLLTGHKTYKTMGNAGKLVSMGSYGILVVNSLNVSFINCKQTNDITDRKFWGIMGSNYSKNLTYNNCKLSRFDEHKGVVNATIINSELGYMGAAIIGSGLFLMENTAV